MSIYVSPTGNDSNAGTSASPVLTLAQAQTLARAAGVNVILRDGTYTLASPLAFTSADNGIAWQAENVGQAIISGAISITGWATDTGSIKKADVPAATVSRSLYVGGTRCFRARVANQPGVETSLTGTGFSFTANPAWVSYGNPTDIELVFGRASLANWWQSRVKVSSVNTGAKTVTMMSTAWGYGQGAPNVLNVSSTINSLGGWDYIENAYELLAQPIRFIAFHRPDRPSPRIQPP